MEQACPEHLHRRLETHSAKIKAFLRSFLEAKVSLEENCFFDLVPNKFLLNYYDVKNEITQHVLENYEKPENYQFLVRLSAVLSDIRSQPLNIDLTSIRDQLHNLPAKNFVQKIKQSKPVCDYNIFGTRTGRLTTNKGTFPILTMDKKFRSVLKPTNDWFVELDFNAAEIRTVLSLCGQEQPDGDIHDWNIRHIYNGKPIRDEAKKKIFAWLYNPNSTDTAPNKYYDKTFLEYTYYADGAVTTPFGRRIEADPHHAINYLVQSASSDNTLKQMIRLHLLLQNSKSFVAFTMHDSVVIDLAHEEKELIPLLAMTFSETALGNFEVNLSAGPDFGSMREI
tara:strand:+ start:104 stop:1117 length:1014 start_codon:yes stop_codon:yes gene_type:complete